MGLFDMFKPSATQKPIQFRTLEDTSIYYKHKYIRWSGKQPLTKTSIQRGPVQIKPGAIGVCYVANLGGLFVGFDSLEPNEIPYDREKPIVSWKYHFQVWPHSERGWEIEQ